MCLKQYWSKVVQVFTGLSQINNLPLVLQQNTWDKPFCTGSLQCHVWQLKRAFATSMICQYTLLLYLLLLFLPSTKRRSIKRWQMQGILVTKADLSTHCNYQVDNRNMVTRQFVLKEREHLSLSQSSASCRLYVNAWPKYRPRPSLVSSSCHLWNLSAVEQ